VIQSNHIAAFALDLKSAYEGEHMIFGLLTLWSSVAPFESILVKKEKKKCCQVSHLSEFPSFGILIPQALMGLVAVKCL
jgi:hypothetical protein